MALFDPVINKLASVLVVVGIGVTIGGGPVAVLTGTTPIVRTVLLGAVSGMLVVLAGVVLHPRTYATIDVDGFRERSERAIWPALILVSFAVNIFPH